jgi:hypothetical protein
MIVHVIEHQIFTKDGRYTPTASSIKFEWWIIQEKYLCKNTDKILECLGEKRNIRHHVFVPARRNPTDEADATLKTMSPRAVYRDIRDIKYQTLT